MPATADLTGFRRGLERFMLQGKKEGEERVIRGGEQEWVNAIDQITDAVTGERLEHVAELNLDAPSVTVVEDELTEDGELVFRRIDHPFTFRAYGRTYRSVGA